MLVLNRFNTVVLAVEGGGRFSFVFSLCACGWRGSPAAEAWLRNQLSFLCFHCLQRHIILPSRCGCHMCMLVSGQIVCMYPRHRHIVGLEECQGGRTGGWFIRTAGKIDLGMCLSKFWEVVCLKEMTYIHLKNETYSPRTHSNLQ